jgi:hypothetical protein
VITVAYGSTSQEYAWGSGALTAASIYTFPSAFTYSTAAFGPGLSVRQVVSSALTLTFSGGDVLHSSVVAAQVESLPASTTASVSIVPSGYSPATPAASVSGTSVTYALSVAYDVVHTGTVTLSYGAAQRQYSWAAGTLTAAHIYTFPSAFTYSGTANGYGTGIHLKQSNAGALTLTFTGGDMLHSSVVATQVEYVKFAQSGVDTTIAAASLACSDPLETVTISSIKPTSTADLTLKVKLRGPDGALSSEITAIIPSAQIAFAHTFSIAQVSIIANLANTYSLFSYSTSGGMTAPGGAILTTNTATLLGWSLPQGFSSTSDGGTSSFCLRLVLDTTLLSYQPGWLLLSNSEDPSIYFDTTNGLYVGENWGGDVRRTYQSRPHNGRARSKLFTSETKRALMEYSLPKARVFRATLRRDPTSS